MFGLLLFADLYLITSEWHDTYLSLGPYLRSVESTSVFWLNRDCKAFPGGRHDASRADRELPFIVAQHCFWFILTRQCSH